jgi:hypothetical protein
MLGQHDWELGEHPWTSDGFASLNREASGGNPGGWLEITMPETGQAPGGDEWFDVISTDASSIFAGGWETRMWVEFDFWADNTAPTAQLRWQSAENDYIWANTVSSGTAQDGWQTFSPSFHDWTDWDTLTPMGASEEQYLADLSTIDWIGVYIWRDGADSQVYGLDDFKLMVPEPQEIIMLVAALMITLVSLRRKGKGSELTATRVA